MMLMLYCLPLGCVAEEQEDTFFFSSFSELQQLCLETEDLPEAILFSATDEPILFSTDFEIPSGRIVSFRQFTVPEGITLTIPETAHILTMALRVEGELYNMGTVIQQEQLPGIGSQDIEIAAWVPGHITNKGYMLLTNVLGKRNISQYGGQLIMKETDRYDDLISGGEPLPDEAITDTSPAPDVPDDSSRFAGINKILMRIVALLEKHLSKASFFLIFVVFFFSLMKSGKHRPAKKNARAQSRRPEHHEFTSRAAEEDHFQRDRRTRVDQLDEWLRNGLIDRKEYRILKQKYEDEKM